MKKRVYSLVLAFVMIFLTAFSFNLNINAAGKGETFKTAYNVGTKGSVTKKWNAGNYQKKCYVKFNLKKNGYAQFKINKPSVEDGSNYYNVFIYNNKGKEVWAISLEEMEKEPGSNFNFKVGLKKGTYYADIRPAFSPEYDYEYDDDFNEHIVYTEIISTKITVTTKTNAYYEIESNNSRSTATTVKLSKWYSGSFCEESYRGKNGYQDWYKVKLTKGKKYKFQLKNYTQLGAGTTICKILKGSQKDEYTYGYYLLEDGSVTVKAKKTGWYYVRLYNDGNETPVDYKLRITKK